MDRMDVDTTPHSPPYPPPTASHTQPPSHPNTHTSSNPISIIPSKSSRFKPAPALPTSQPRPDPKSAFAPFAPAPVTSMYSQKMFKPLSNTSSPTAAPPTLSPSHPPSAINETPPISQASIASNPISRPQQSSSSDTKNVFPVRRTPFKPSAPVQIPRSSVQKASVLSDSNAVNPRSLGAPVPAVRPLSYSADVPIPQSLPNIPPSYPATLFGGLSADDEHVTVWEPHTGKTVAGNAAPYRRNLAHWLECHPGWEEKSDELKSSKRRSAARRGRSAADAFAALCHYPVAAFLTSDAAQHLKSLGGGDHLTEETMMNWVGDDFVRLQEAIFRLGQECHRHGMTPEKIDRDRWSTVCKQVGGSKLEGTVVACAHQMLTRGIAKSRKEQGSLALPASFGAVPSPVGDAMKIGSPASFSSYDTAMGSGFDFAGPSSLPGLSGASGALLLEKSFRTPREPRVTVWNPSNGRTISGNAAPCKRNLETWMREHPGWIPKEEGQLSSSRRNRNRKIRPSSMPSGSSLNPSSVEPESPHFNEALQGLLCLSRSPTAYSPSDAEIVDSEMAEDESTTPCQAGSANNGMAADKNGMISSVSSSSAEDGNDGGVRGSEIEDVATKRMEL